MSETGRRLAGEFASEHGQALMRLVWLLTRGDDAASQDLVQSALAKMLVHGFDRIEFPLAFARKSMLTEVRDQSRRRGLRLRALSMLENEAVVRTRASVTPPAEHYADDRERLFAGALQSP